ncbi:MAG: hypothetical protein P8H93_05500 [Polaribacter sp.]|nr:hypothetical protein [Polaribacter sp.]
MLNLIRIDCPFFKKRASSFSLTVANPLIAIKISTEFDTERCTTDETNSTLLISKYLALV